MRLLTMAYEEVMNEIADRASVILIPYVLLILIIDTTNDLNSVCEIEHLLLVGRPPHHHPRIVRWHPFHATILQEQQEGAVR